MKRVLIKRILMIGLLAGGLTGCTLLGLTAETDDSDMFTLAAAAVSQSGTSTSSDVDSTDSDDSGTSSDDGTEDTSSTESCLGDPTSISSDIPAWIADNFKCVTVTLVNESGTDYYKFETDTVPDHKSPYWGSTSDNYEDMPSGNTAQVSNFDAQTYQFLIPVTPESVSGNKIATPAVAIGVAVNGVVFFGGEASSGNTLSSELTTFDSAQGHPTGGEKIYHYHAEPKYISNYETGLVGIMADGYPVYGPKEEDGTTPSTSGATGSSGQYPALETDTYAHSHATSHFPGGIVHYHITNWDSTVNIPTMPIYTYGKITPSNVTY